MANITSSVRGLVKRENARLFCCCLKCPAGARWQKVPLEVFSALSGKGKSKEERKLDRLRFLAKSVVDKTIETIIGNPMSSTGFVTFNTITAAAIAIQTRLYPAPLQMITR